MVRQIPRMGVRTVWFEAASARKACVSESLVEEVAILLVAWLVSAHLSDSVSPGMGWTAVLVYWR